MGRGTMAARSPMAHAVDRLVGRNVREQRALQNYTQEWLAAKLGISYQQVQKYETGSNRISCGRLYEIARHLNISIAALYRGIEQVDETALEPYPQADPASAVLVEHFMGVDDRSVRSAIAGLVKSIAKSEGPVHAKPP